MFESATVNDPSDFEPFKFFYKWHKFVFHRFEIILALSQMKISGHLTPRSSKCQFYSVLRVLVSTDTNTCHAK